MGQRNTARLLPASLPWRGDPMAVMAAPINALGYGLTLGIQTRIDSRAQALARATQGPAALLAG